MTISNSLLAGKISDLLDVWRLREREYQDWIGGTADGGPYSNGTYPITDYAGVVHYIKSPARLALDVTGVVDSAESFAEAAESHAEAALGSQNSAASSATSASGYRDAAQAARDLALSYRDAAANSAANSATSATNAATSATNAAASAATAAAISADWPINAYETAEGFTSLTLSRGYFYLNAKRYGAVGDGVADDTVPLRKLYNIAAAVSIATGRPVTVIIPEGKYLITSSINVSGAISGITTIGYGAELIIDASVGDQLPALHFGYALPTLSAGTLSWDETVGRVATTTASAAISKTSRTVTVASTTGMAIGQLVTISSSSEYFFGITGDSGNNVRYKSEMNRIRSVDSSTQITLDHFPEDDYSVTGPTVTVSAYNSIKDIHFIGLTLRGPGNGSALSASSSGPTAIRVEWCEGVSFANGRMENFNNTAWRDFQCWGVRIVNNHIVGRMTNDSSNLPTVSIWFYGPGSHGSCHLSFLGNVCRNLRRPNDIGPIGATTVARHIVQSNNNVSGGQNGIGAHMCQYVTAEGNEIADCVSGYFYRAKDITISGGRVRTTGTNASDAVIVLGSVPGGAYSEEPSLGAVRISNVQAYGAQNFLKTQNAFDSLDMVNCRMSGHAGYFLWTVGKAVRNLKVKGCYSDSSARTSSSRYGIYIQNDSTNPMTVVDGIDIEGNTILNGAEGVRIDGANVNTAPAKNITVRGNTFPACSVSGLTSDIRLGESGYYDGATISLGPNNHWSSPSNVTVRLSANSAAGMHRYNQMPLLDVARKHIGSATSSALASPSWSNTSSKATLRSGMRVLNSSPAAAAYSEWIVTANGTTGTITASTTGDITSGTAALTINSNSDDRVFVGAYITIAGAGAAGANLAARVIAVSGTSVTIDTNASTTVTGAAISYTNPTLKGLGLIES